MQRVFPPIVFLLVMLSCQVVGATQWSPMTTAEAVDWADLVAVGTTDGDGEAADSLFLEMVLKGEVEAEQAVPFRATLRMETPIPPGRRGLFMLKQHDDGTYGLFHPISYQGDEIDNRGAAVERAQRMWADPAVFMEEQGDQPDADLIYILGEELRALEVRSTGDLNLTTKDLMFEQRRQNVIPWELRGVVTAHVDRRPDRDPPLRITSADEGSPLLPYLVDRLRMASRWDNDLSRLDGSLEVTLDTRGPDRVAGRDAAEVRAYLRAALKADMGWERRGEMFEALAKARDLDAIEPIAAMLTAEESVAHVAARWLHQTYNQRAVPPLLAVVASADFDQKGYQPVVEEAAHALYDIGGVEALPTLRRAARHREYYATSALGKYGNADDFQLLLDAGNERPTDTSGVQGALLQLVRRSNLPVEEWMNSPTWNAEIGAEKQPLWNRWWEEHWEEFRLRDTAGEGGAEGG